MSTLNNDIDWFDPKAKFGECRSANLVTPRGRAYWFWGPILKGWYMDGKPFPLPALVRLEIAKKKAINFEELRDIALAKDAKQASKEWDEADLPAWDDMNVTQQTAACNLAERQGRRFIKLTRKTNA